MVIVGAALIGFFIVEIHAVLARNSLPMVVNIIGAVAFALVAAGLVL
jgi:hypothetical protein